MNPRVSTIRSAFAIFKTTFLLLAILIRISTHAQQATKEVQKSDLYGEGGKKEILTIPYPNGGKREEVKVYDRNGVVREVITRDSNVTGKNRLIYDFRDCRGRFIYYERSVTDTKTGEEISYEKIINNKNSERAELPINYGYRKSKQDDGTWKIEKYDTLMDKWEIQEPSVDTATEKTSYEPDKSTCPIGGPRWEVFGGYSFLYAGFEPESDQLHGWAASLYYNLNRNWAIGLYGTSHSKSKDDFKANMNFLQVGLKYCFSKMEYDKKPLLEPFVWIGAGIGSFHSELSVPGLPKFESDETSFAGSLGAGLNLNIGKHVDLRLVRMDYLITDFYGNTQNNFRASTGVKIDLGNLAIKY